MGDATNTIEVDLTEIDNETFRNVFIQTAEALPKLQKSETDAIVQVMKDNDTYRIDAFFQVPKKAFCTQLKKQLGIKPGVGCRLRNKIKKTLRMKAQQIQFGTFLSNLNIKNVQKDYHHILRDHIYSDNQDLVENCFSFFGNTVHYDDTAKDTKNCKSIQRRKHRAKALKEASNATSQHVEDAKEDTPSDFDAVNLLSDTDSWKLNQYHAQRELDLIHSYLVHFDWKTFISNKRDE
eukprot:1068232_1